MKYRPEIDSLRAIAVVPVVFFHAGINIFKGGFLGVDVFFVISGFLITTILVDEIENDSFSIMKFYERRARRILPLLILVLLVSVAVAFFVLLPEHFEKMIRSANWALAFASNVFFWRNTGYFDLDADLQPLLHTWSLAVEEQFYLVYPLLMVALFRLLRGNVRQVYLVTSALLVASLAVAELGSEYAPTANFYLIFSRAWELGIGALCAFWMRSRTVDPGPMAAKMADVGLVALAICYYLFDRFMSFHPGHLTVIPVVATAIYIAFISEKSFGYRILIWAPFVYIGRVSYGIYLWHFPIFSMMYYGFEELNSAQVSGMITVTIFLSIASYHWFETPFRRLNVSGKNYLIGSIVAIIVTSLIINALGFMRHNLLSENQAYVAEVSKQPMDEEYQCMLKSDTETPSALNSRCIDPSREIFVWGDSHSDALARGFRYRGAEINQISANSCPPVRFQAFYNLKHCEEINAFAFNAIVAAKPKVVIIDGYWYDYNQQKMIMLGQTLTDMKQALPETKIIFVGTVPLWHPALSQNLQKSDIKPDLSTRLIPPNFKLQLEHEEMMKARIAETDAIFFSALSTFCDDLGCRVVAADDAGKLYLTTYDYGHLNPSAARELAEAIGDALATTLRTPNFDRKTINN